MTLKFKLVLFNDAMHQEKKLHVVYIVVDHWQCFHWKMHTL